MATRRKVGTARRESFAGQGNGAGPGEPQVPNFLGTGSRPPVVYLRYARGASLATEPTDLGFLGVPPAGPACDWRLGDRERTLMLLRLPSDVNDLDLMRIGAENPGYRFEREEDGSLIVSPTSTKGGAKSLEAAAQLRDYKKVASGNAYDSNTGFAVGPGLRVYAPDASWVSQPRIDAQVGTVTEDGFWPLSPDVVIEVKSKTDGWPSTVDKIRTFIARGTLYAVAINPETREVVPLGVPPPGLALDFDAIIDA